MGLRAMTLTDKIVLTVNVLWDAHSKMWVAISDDIPGLATEADSYERLVQRVKDAAPELLELNGIVGGHSPVPVAFQHYHYDTISV
jgi:predicted RNase H-like HicB family nuclease